MASATPTRREEGLDTTVRLVTPERIVFHYPLAGPFRRYVAYLIDLALVLALTVGALVVFLLLALGSFSGLGPFLVAYFGLMWGYRGFCEAVFNGQTWGKMLVGIRVVTDRGVPITGAQAVLRNVVGALDGVVPYLLRPDLTSVLLMIGLASMLLTRKFQRLGDLAAGTMVVVEERRARVGVTRVEGEAVAQLLALLPVRVSAGPELARALSDYVDHRARLGAAVCEGMAAPLARPLRQRYGLPANAPADAVLCAVYHRVFVGE
jgi:uncharacterized RDD family membrane protein YckC